MKVLSSFTLLFFCLSFAFFQIQSGDVLLYLALARDFVLSGDWPQGDPYLYSRPAAPLHIAHEYASYLLFHSAWQLGDWAGLIWLKALLLGSTFALALSSQPLRINKSILFVMLWPLAVLAASFRFVERSSLVSDLFCVLLCFELYRSHVPSRGLLLRLTLLFFVWVQFHPGFPVGVVILLIWFMNERLRANWPWSWLWVAIPLTALLLNPLGLTGALYPFRFALNEAQTLKLYNFEWLPAYHKLFRTTPEVMAFWVFVGVCGFVILRDRLWSKGRGQIVIFCLVLAVLGVRFIPMAVATSLLLLKPWLKFQSPRLLELNRWPGFIVIGLLITVGVKNLHGGYSSSSGLRRPGWSLDARFFPTQTAVILQQIPQGGRLYNSHDFGGYLIWQKQTPVFHHGFVTDMEFYASEVIGAMRTPEEFLRLARTYNWTMLLVDKGSSYRFLHHVLSGRPQWKIVAEDEASYLIYLEAGAHP